MIGHNRSTNSRELVILGLRSVGKQGKAFMNFGKERSLLNTMKQTI